MYKLFKDDSLDENKVMAMKTEAIEYFQFGEPLISFHKLEYLINTLSSEDLKIENKNYHLCECSLYMCDLLVLQLDFQKASDLLDRVTRVTDRKLTGLDRKIMKFLVMVKMGDVLLAKKMNEPALEAFIHASNYFLNLKVSKPDVYLIRNLSFTHRTISDIYYKFREKKLAVDYLSESIDNLLVVDKFVGFEAPDMQDLAYREELQGLLFFYQNKSNSSKKSFIKAIDILTKLGSSSYNFDLLYSLARNQQQLGVWASVNEDLELSKRCYLEACNIYKHLIHKYDFRKLQFEHLVVNYRLRWLCNEMGLQIEAEQFRGRILSLIGTLKECNSVLPIAEIARRVAA